MLALLQNWEKLTWLCGICVLLGLAGHFFVFHFLRNLAKRSKGVLDDSTVKHCYRPLQWTVILLVIHLLLPVLTPRSRFYSAARHVTSLVLIGLVAWLAIKAVLVLEDWVVGRFEVDTTDNLRARKIHTQLRVMKRIAILLVAILALGTMLMTFDQVRQLGTTILASAGIIGIVVGMAAQRTIGSFIAGLQIALTQPIRVDDVVIVENEWGRIEEITLTYVVVKIWDLRRLVVPITYFIEKPFQNWTRVTADILGTVYLYVDYTVPVESVREELQRILKDSELWDSKVCVLQVTNTSERAVELRALMSAEDASKAWSLRCEVREKLITFIKKDYPQSLPKLRAEFYPLKGDEGQARE